ncbi:ATP-dependent zinc protease [Candidatus Saccharibacteria bacterium]|nr:ATP-dependent zinc protease [Candidatus Saccharibacteria bacterium]
MNNSPITVGTLELVSIPGLNIVSVLAKIDTGAYSGALHCSSITVVLRGVTRQPILKFIPLGDTSLSTETADFSRRYVRSATGHRVKRYIIQTEIVIKSKRYPIAIGLSDRSEMKRVVLIGRSFLRENNMLVDVRINQELDDERETFK